jgi:saccharopine dehydrogenase-like NADP-dependent oxidoreductase
MSKAKAPVYTVLGGAGAMGSITVRDLLETTSADSKIIIADYNLEKAQALAAGHKRVKAVQVNIHQPEAMTERLKGTTVLLNSLRHDYNLTVMELALKLGAHYTDLGGLFHMTRRQLALHDRFAAAGLTAVVCMGAAPGITNLLAAQAATAMEQVHGIHVRLAAVDKTRYSHRQVLPVSYSFKTIIEEFSLQPAIFTRGRYRFLKPMSGLEPYRFPAPIGLQYPMYTLHSEICTLAESYRNQGVQEVSFKIAFPLEFVEKVRFLRDLGLADHDPVHFPDGSAVAPIDLVNHVVMHQPQPQARGELRQHEVLRAIVQGVEQGKRLTRIHDLYTAGMPQWGIGTDIDTGTPPSVVAQMLVSGQVSRRGVLAPEQAVPIAPFFAALEQRGMYTRSQSKRGWQVPI